MFTAFTETKYYFLFLLTGVLINRDKRQFFKRQLLICFKQHRRQAAMEISDNLTIDIQISGFPATK